MALEQFIEKNFRGKSEERIEQAKEIMDEYASKGFDLTLRQLYYQFVSRDLIENTQRSYKQLGSLIADARLAGRLDWNMLNDRTRSLKGRGWSSSPEYDIRWAARSFQRNMWEDQDFHVEVWVEKEALASVVWDAAYDVGISYFACKGYASASSMYTAAKRLQRKQQNGKQVVILYLGDHDPSGLDMDRDIRERLFLMGVDPTNFIFERIGLTMEQIEYYQPPPNPAKLTDVRAREYVAEHGEVSWELDALAPEVIVELIKEHALAYRDEDIYEAVQEYSDRQQELMLQVADRWDEVVEFLQGGEEE